MEREERHKFQTSSLSLSLSHMFSLSLYIEGERERGLIDEYSTGFTGIKSLTADKVFDKYFPPNEILNFEKFHIKFLQICYDFNSGMLGKHYYAPPDKVIEKCYGEWSQKQGDEYKEERKKLLLELLNTHVKVIKTDDAILVTGVVAPPAAMVLKKYSQNMPQLKRFRLDLVPDIAFVPTFAVAALCAVKVLQFKAGGKTK